MKLTELFNVADLESTSRMDPNMEPLARALAEESLERAKVFGPTFLAFAQQIALTASKKA